MKGGEGVCFYDILDEFGKWKSGPRSKSLGPGFEIILCTLKMIDEMVFCGA